MGLKCAIIAAWHRRSGVKLKALQNGKEQELRDWYLHLLNQHVPFRRDCEQCLIGAGRDSRRERQEHAGSYVMAIDVAGPSRPGGDQDSQKPRYFLVAVATVPCSGEKPLIEG